MTEQNKMYVLKKIVDLPNEIPKSSAMFPLKSTYTLKGNLADTYYGNPTMDVNGNPEIEGIAARQLEILEKLKKFQTTLDELKKKNSSQIKIERVSTENFVTSEQDCKQGLVSIITNVQNQLGALARPSSVENEICGELSSSHAEVLNELRLLGSELDVFKSGVSEVEARPQSPIDVQKQQERIVEVVVALQDLLKNDIATLQENVENGGRGGLYAQHEQIIKLVDRLRDELEKLMANVAGHPNHPIEEPEEATGVDLVIACPPTRPPYSIIFLKKALREFGYKIYSSASTHSSLKSSQETCAAFTEDFGKPRGGYHFFFSVQWKDQKDTSLMINPLRQSAIEGESNIVRYLSRLFPSSSALNSEGNGVMDPNIYAALVDEWLDNIESKLLAGEVKEKMSFLKKINSRLGTSTYLVSDNLSVADIFAWSAIAQLNLPNIPSNVTIWFNKILQEGNINIEHCPAIQKNEKDIPKNNPASDEKIIDRSGLESFLKNKNIHYQVFDHPAVFTVDTAMEYMSDVPGIFMKNLFLKDKKGKLYLLAVRHDASTQLKDIAAKVKTKDLRFADEAVLFETMGVTRGSVSAYALINDTKGMVTLLLDSSVLAEDVSYVNFHPMTNTATLGVSPSNLRLFLDAINHSPVIIEV